MVLTVPRKYQCRIANALIQTTLNSIVVLPTGSGKTLIANMVIEHLLKMNGKIIFIVPTRLLVKQQALAISEELNIMVHINLGGRAAPPAQDRVQIIVSTADSFLQLSKKDKRFALSAFDLIILDEAHHATKSHPYGRLAKQIQHLQPESRPRIIGLTASLTYESKSRLSIEKSIQALLVGLNIDSLQGASKDELKAEIPSKNLARRVLHGLNLAPETVPVPFSPADFHKFVKNRFLHPLCLQLVAFTELVEGHISALDASFEPRLSLDNDLKNWGSYANKFGDSNTRNFCLVLEHCYEAIRILITSGGSDVHLALQYFLKMALPDQCSSTFPSELVVNLNELNEAWERWGEDTPGKSRVLQLRQAVSDAVQECGIEHFRCIIFVQQSVCTYVLKHYLNSDSELGPKLRPSVLHATGSKSGTATYRISPSQSEKRLEDFASGACNLLVSTGVSEEGMDISAANYVIRFDPVQTPVSLVQSRGRARTSKSRFVVLHQTPSQPLTAMQRAEQIHDEIVAEIAFGGDPNRVLPGKKQSNYRRL